MEFLSSQIKLANYYRKLGKEAINQLSNDEINWRPDNHSNSIATIVQHLEGNMLSRWTNFMTEDGEKSWRDRDREFDDCIQNKKSIIDSWNRGWDCFIGALNELTHEDLSKIIYIRNEGHSVLEAINRQMAHYPYHVGQIVYIAKTIKKDNWKTLSIPKNQSKEYNKDKFQQEKSIKHFTDNQ